MMHKKVNEETDNAIRVSVTNEMAKPRMSSSARIAAVNLDTASSRTAKGRRARNRHPINKNKKLDH